MNYKSIAMFVKYNYITRVFTSSKLLAICLVFMLSIGSVVGQTIYTITIPGAVSLTVPAGVVSVTIECWGAGGAGGGSNLDGFGGDGGGAGAYTSRTYTVTPGQPITGHVGAGGTGVVGNSGNNGQDTYATVSGVKITAGGGSGGWVRASNTIGSGGAGGKASDGTTNTPGNPGIIGTASGGNGGDCPNGGTGGAGNTNGNGNPGTAPGGGGGGGERGNGNGNVFAGGKGGNGQMRITYTYLSTMWYKADIGTNVSVDGVGITTWNDQSGTANNASSRNTAPTYQAIGWNFNPSINFSTGYFLSATNSIFDDMTFFTVYNTSSTGNGNPWECPTIIGGEVSGVQDDYYLSLNDGKPFFKAKDPDGGGAISTTVTADNFPRILSATHKKVNNGGNYLYINGTQSGFENMGDRGNISLTKPTQLGIGNHFSPLNNAQFVGGITEVMGSRSVFTTKARENFESYLAIKYGITLSHNYTHSDSTTIYTITGYSNDIAGLGRNDTWKLHQKVSASSNMASGNSRVVMATNPDFTSSNLSPSRTALTNGQYLIWGHNNGTTSAWKALGITTPTDSIVNRIWRVENTNNVGSVYFQIDLSGYVSENGIYRLLVADNTNFTGATSYFLTKTTGNLYTVTATANAATASTVTFPTGVRYFTIGQKSNYWKGAETSTDWGTSTNWTASEVPPPGAKVEYATVLNNGSVALNNLVLDLPERTVSRIINATTKSLEIPAERTLKVTNNISTDGNPDRILIKSALAKANGSLIIPNATAVKATVEMYSKASKNLVAQNDRAGKPFWYNWQFFGVPVKNLQAEPTFYNSYVRKYEENNSGLYTKWNQLTNSSMLEPFKGYEITQEFPKTIIFKGELINDPTTTISLPVTGTGVTPTVYFRGQHILSNPFTAAIDVNQLTFGNNTENTVYLYNTGSFGNWSQNNGNNTYDDATVLAGQYIAIPKRLAGDLGIPNNIPSMSGFLVKATDTLSVNPAPGSITINYVATAIGNVNPQRVKRHISESSSDAMNESDNLINEDIISTKIDITGQHYSDKMWIFTESSCSRKFDNGWDGPKMLGSSLAPQIYSVEPDGIFQVNSVDDMHDTQIAFQPGDEVEYTLKFTHQNISNKYAGVYLVDLLENKTIDVTESGSTYKFATLPATSATNRFKIITRYYEKDAADINTSLKVFSARSSVFVQNLGTEIGECTLHDISGRAVKKMFFAPNSVAAVFNNLARGAYVVSALSNGEKVSKRVIVQ